MGEISAIHPLGAQPLVSRSYLIGEVLYRSRFLDIVNCQQRHRWMLYGEDLQQNRHHLGKLAKHNHAWHDMDKSRGINVGTPSLYHWMKENQ
ncbi:hypothetical protein HAX54_019175, partial [Datura stramonium]|nr:hypothetical protein [Datura stramonium]